MDELSFTVTGAPMISLKKPLGSLLSEGAPFSIVGQSQAFGGWSSTRSTGVIYREIEDEGLEA